MSARSFDAITPGDWEPTTLPDSGGESRNVVTCGQSLICAVSRRGGRKAESDANARLLAAAPKFLEALEAIIKAAPTSDPYDMADSYNTGDTEAAESFGMECGLWDAARIARLAIAKGGEPVRCREAGGNQPACKTCSDTHLMWLEDIERYVQCTKCPTPCNECSDGAYCAETPCKCSCHKVAKKTKETEP